MYNNDSNNNNDNNNNNNNNNNISNINNNIEPANKKLVLQLIKQNSELQSLLLEQNKHLMNCINI